MNGTLLRVALMAAAVSGPVGPALAAQIKVTTDPTGASVQLDGVSHGPSPVTIPEVSRGAHTLKVSLEGYLTREDLIEVDGDSDLQIHAPLNPAPKLPPPEPPKPPKATPPASEPAAQASPPPIAFLPPPPPPLPAVEARPQAPLPVSELPAAWGAPKKTLVLLVETVPAQAFVQVVGMPEVKRAPATFTGFSPGTIQLQVRAPGFKDKKVEVDLQHDARTRVTLEPL